ncbi:MAG: alpha-tubulin suppressor-like RCC1 family protein [Psychromonas sp.]|jgi:alpha-tubulin suppressor-like RCC1 family protein
MNKLYQIWMFFFLALLAACGGGGGGSGGSENGNKTLTLSEDGVVSFASNIINCQDYWTIKYPENGTLRCLDSEFTYSPYKNYYGDDVFEYQSSGDGRKYKVSFSIKKQKSDPVKDIIINDDAFCALLESGIIQCFGSQRLERLVPQNTKNVSEIAYGARGVCTIENNEVNCTENSGVNIPSDIYNPTKLYGKGGYICARHDYGLSCWGNLEMISIPDIVNPSSISASSGSLCVIDLGILSCSGTGYGSDITQAPLMISPTKVATGRYSTCVIDDGGVVCWGAFNDGSTGGSPTELTPSSFINPVDIAVGSGHACAIDDTGVVCWGIDRLGHTQVPDGIVNPKKVFAHHNSTCVIDDNGLICWLGGYSQYNTSVPGNLYSLPP